MERIMQREQDCPCTKTDCERRGDCVVCYNHHKSTEKPVFCQRPDCPAVKELEERVIARLRAAGCIDPIESARAILRSQGAARKT